MTSIYFNEEEWNNLKKEKTKEEIIDIIYTMIKSGKIKYPVSEHSLNDVIRLFEKLLTYDYTQDIKKSDKIEFKFDYEYKNVNRYIKKNNTYNIISNYFNQEERWKARNKKNLNPYQLWYDDKKLKFLLDSISMVFYRKKFSDIELRNMISIRGSICTQFSVHLSKVIYSLFNSKNILDFSAGWGDRLAGFFCVPETESYVGIDPNKNVFKNYAKQIQVYNSIRYGYTKKVEMINQPSEDVNLSKYEFDTIFTSPPYFDLEIYDTENTQSYIKYPEFKEWCNKFLFKTIEKSWDRLKDNGYLIINISDFLKLKERFHICDEMNNFISKLPNSSYEECIGYQLQQRPLEKRYNDKKTELRTVYEPIWVWKKK